MASNTNSCNLSKAESEMVSHVIDIKELKDVNTFEHEIYRVPSILRNLNKEAYSPQLISIGPLHFNQKKLNPMQKYKLQYFHHFWVRVGKNVEVAMNNFKRSLEEKKAHIRHRYAAKFSHIDDKQFVDMLLLDAVFIVELFLRISLEEKDEQDCILKQTWLSKSIQRDLLLLENQIPFSILDELYGAVVPNANTKGPRFIELALDYFECFHPCKCSTSDDKTGKSESDHKPSKCGNPLGCGFPKTSSFRFEQLKKNWKTEPIHFTDLIRYFYLCEELSPPEKQASCNVLRTATKLQEAGVTFEKKKSRPLLDIKFKRVPILSWFLCLGCIPKFTCFKARLQIPQLKVDDATECVLRNLIAFEQCHYANKPFICNYVSLIDSLIHTKDDVELLVEKEVIEHELGSDKEVATLVNGLCKHVVTDVTCYKGIIDKLNKHYQRQWNRTMAALWLVYFRDTWRTSSTVVGIAILVFAIFNFWRVVQLIFEHKPLKF